MSPAGVIFSVHAFGYLGTILGRFSINYFSARLGLRIRVWVSVGVGVRVSVVIWSG